MKRFYCFLFFAITLFLIYFPSLNADFYLDDFSSIVHNGLIKAPVDWQKIINVYGLRTLPYSLFAAQYSFFQDSTLGYHLVSLLIHIASSVLVFGILLCLLEQSVSFESRNSLSLNGNINKIAAGIATLIFAFHPQNSQAVIYIVQQIALIAAFFSLLSLYAFLKGRLSANCKHQFIWLTLSFLSFIAAMLSKQNVVVLPLVFLLIEFLIIKKSPNKLGFLFAAAVLIAGLSAYFYVGNFDKLVTLVDSFTRENSELTRLEYFYTQLAVLAHYIKQFYIPLDFRLEYDVTIAKAFSVTELTYLTLHIGLILLGLAFIKKAPLASLALFSFYVLHAVESSFIPIRDVAFEHRTYLPNIMHSVLIASLFTILLKVNRLRTYLVLLSVIIVSALSIITHERAKVWADKFAFYKNEISISKRNPRLYMSLGQMYIDNDQCHLALSYFDHAIRLYDMAHASNLGKQPELFQNYAKCLFSLGMQQQAFNLLDKLQKQVKRPNQKAMLYAQKGKMLMDLKMHKKARFWLRKAYQLDNKQIYILVNLAICEAVLKNFNAAKYLLESALVVNPSHAMAIELLQKVNRVVQSSESKKVNANQ